MHFTEPLYRNPYWPTFPLLKVTQDVDRKRDDGGIENFCRKS